jgi:hypothetical protein
MSRSILVTMFLVTSVSACKNAEDPRVRRMCDSLRSTLDVARQRVDADPEGAATALSYAVGYVESCSTVNQQEVVVGSLSKDPKLIRQTIDDILGKMKP